MVFGANIFICIRVLLHLKYWVYWGFLSSKLNKMYKNHSSFWNRFFKPSGLYRAIFPRLYVPAKVQLRASENLSSHLRVSQGSTGLVLWAFGSLGL